MAGSLDAEAIEIGRKFRDDRQANDQNLKTRFEEIFRKYERDFTGVGDEIDLATGEIVIDNGHLHSMRHEVDPGKRTASSIIKTFALDNDTESGSTTPNIQADGQDAAPFEHILQHLGREIEDLSEHSSASDGGVITEDSSVEEDVSDEDLPTEIDTLHRAPDDGSTHGNSSEMLPSQIRILQSMPGALKESILAMQSTGAQFDKASLDKLERSITGQIAQFLAASADSKAQDLSLQPGDATYPLPVRETAWSYPDLPDDDPQQDTSPQAAGLASSSAPFIMESPAKHVSLWAPVQRGRPRRRPIREWTPEPSGSEYEDVESELSDDEGATNEQGEQISSKQPLQPRFYTANTARRIVSKRPDISMPQEQIMTFDVSNRNPLQGSQPQQENSDVRTTKNQPLSCIAPDENMAESIRAMQVQYVRDMAQERQSRFLLSGERMDFSTSNEPRSGSGVLYTKQEDELMFELRCVQNVPWSVIRDYLPGRSMESLLNRWSYIRRRILPDLIAEGAIHAKNVRPVQQSTKDMLASKKLSLSSSYRADALRHSMLQPKGGTRPAESQKQFHPGPISVEWQRRYGKHSTESRANRQPVEVMSGMHTGRGFNSSEDRIIKQLRESDKLLFCDIAKRFPGTTEAIISDRYYNHILGKSIPVLDKPRSGFQPLQPRPYLTETLRPPPIPDFIKPTESLHPPKFRPLLPAPSATQSATNTGHVVQTKTPPAPGTFILDERMLNFTQTRQPSRAGQPHPQESLQLKHPGPVMSHIWQPVVSSAVHQKEALPVLAHEQTSRTVKPHPRTTGARQPPKISKPNSRNTGARKVPSAAGSGSAMPARRPRDFPSSIPDTEDERWQSSQSQPPHTDKPHLINQQPSPRLQVHLPAPIEETAERRQSQSSLSSQEYIEPIEKHTAQQDEEIPISDQDTGNADLSLDKSPKTSQLDTMRVRSSTPLQQGYDLSFPASSPPFPVASYGTPARWNQHSMPYYFPNTTDPTDPTLTKPDAATKQSQSADPCIESSDGKILPALTVPNVAERSAHRKRKSDTVVDHEVYSSSSVEHASKKHRSRQRLIAHSDDEDACPGMRTSMGNAGNELDKSLQPLTTSFSSRSTKSSTTSSRASEIMSPAAAVHKAPPTRSIEDIRASSSGTRSHSRSSEGVHETPSIARMAVAKVRPPECASRTVTRGKDRVSDLKKQARGPTRRHSAPATKASRGEGKRASDTAVRRMSSLVDQLSDDELA